MKKILFIPMTVVLLCFFIYIITYTLVPYNEDIANEVSKNTSIVNIEEISIEGISVSLLLDDQLNERPKNIYPHGIEVVPMENFENPFDFSDITVFTDKAIIIDNLIFIPVLCEGIYDEYVYNVETKTGIYLSGVQSLRRDHHDLIKITQNHQQPCQALYLNNIVSINDDLSAAIVRKSNFAEYNHGKYLSGEYYIMDLETNSCTYICDSYPNYSTSIPGTQIEYIEWINNNNVRIFTYDSSGNSSNITYAVKNNDIWKITAEHIERDK
ncbi:MAG: hypothetical protein IKD37_06585 [Clostridia bacterium]|nr:hypothetical protein [Clostridia bacterium]